MQDNGVPIDIEEKIAQIKKTFDDLGWAQDEVIELTGINDKDSLDKQAKWYNNYIKEVNKNITLAREYLESIRHRKEQVKPDKSAIKIERLKLPVSTHKSTYVKWKRTFERYTKEISDELKYDYLLENTAGKAHVYVENRSNYHEAVHKLDQEFGNKNLIMSILIDDLRSREGSYTEKY